MGDLDLPLTCGSCVNLTQHTKRHVDRFSRFGTAHRLAADSLHTLQWVPLSPKIDPSHGVSEPLSNTWLIGPVT